jgi:hypothetical protein
MWFVWRPVLPDGVDLFAWISGLALGGNTTLAKWRRITGRVNYRALPVAGCYLDTGRGGIAVLFLNVLAAGRIELDDEAGETGGIAIFSSACWQPVESNWKMRLGKRVESRYFSSTCWQACRVLS